MKILHTSDWHLGHQLYGYDRTEEQLSMLYQMQRIAESEAPDVFLISGDVFHVAQPSAGVQKMFADAILNLRRQNPGMSIIATAGNHDSGSRHEIFRTPWSALGVDMIGQFDRERPENHIIEIAGKGYVVAVPYVSVRFLQDGMFQRLLDIVNERNSDRLPVVLAAHTTVRGADFRGHDAVRKEEEDYFVGGIDGLSIDELGEGYDYLALGHIHHEQFVHTGRDGGHHRVRYCGSPMAVSFDEDYPHSVSIVELEKPGYIPNVRKIEIQNPRPLITLPAGGGTTDWDTALELLRHYPPERLDYIRLQVEQEAPLLPGFNEEAIQAAKGKNCRYCLVNYKSSSKGRGAAGVSMSVNEFREESPIEVARRHLEWKGIPFGEEMEILLREAMQRVNEENERE